MSTRKNGFGEGGRADIVDKDVMGAAIAMKESFAWLRGVVKNVTAALEERYPGDWVLTLSVHPEHGLEITIQLESKPEMSATYAVQDNQLRLGVTEGSTDEWEDCEEAFIDNDLALIRGATAEPELLLVSKCVGYCKFKAAVEMWVEDFNAEWSEEPSQLHSKYEWYDTLYSVDIYGFGEHSVTVMFGETILYEFCLSSFPDDINP